MKVILECSHQYINTIKRKLNAHLEQITYLDSFTGNDLSLFIKEVKKLEDIENIKNIKSIRSANINADLDELINRIEYLNKGLGVMLEFQCGYQTVRMNVKNITYVESYAHYLLIHTLNSTVKVREKISVALQKLEPLGFIQVHRSYVINHDRIKKIDTDNITLSDETIIPIGKKYKQALKNH